MGNLKARHAHDVVHVVDDDLAMRVALESMLRSVGYEVVLYESGTALIEAAPKGLSGSCFWFAVPLIRVADAQGQSNATAIQPVERALTVLVVDDVHTNRLMLQALLQDLGCRAILADSGIRALRQLRHSRVDAVLMDLSMPELDGLETMRRLRALPAPIGQLPVIGISGYTDTAKMRAMADSGMALCLPKPVAAAALRAALQQIAATQLTCAVA